MKGYYDAKVRGVSFRPGDFVYRANDASHAKDTGKLGPKVGRTLRGYGSTWEKEIQLERKWMGVRLPGTWNILQSQELLSLGEVSLCYIHVGVSLTAHSRWMRQSAAHTVHV
ncbi:hypothetical protein Tco_1253946 [Tanacetum coccineum]